MACAFKHCMKKSPKKGSPPTSVAKQPRLSTISERPESEEKQALQDAPV